MIPGVRVSLVSPGLDEVDESHEGGRNPQAWHQVHTNLGELRCEVSDTPLSSDYRALCLEQKTFTMF